MNIMTGFFSFKVASSHLAGRWTCRIRQRNYSFLLKTESKMLEIQKTKLKDTRGWLTQIQILK